MFENILRFIRSKMHSKTVVIGAVAAATLALVVGGGPVAARVLGHGAFGASSLTSRVGPGSEGSQGSKAAGNSSLAADPNRQAGSPGGGTTNRDPGRKTACPSGGVPAPGS
ncbi:MAG TPA: hypothetical protein VNA31_07870, partial [bacterium]|nr:hypothetical protein [bacterium]